MINLVNKFISIKLPLKKNFKRFAQIFSCDIFNRSATGDIKQRKPPETRNTFLFLACKSLINSLEEKKKKNNYYSIIQFMKDKIKLNNLEKKNYIFFFNSLDSWS